MRRQMNASNCDLRWIYIYQDLMHKLDRSPHHHGRTWRDRVADRHRPTQHGEVVCEQLWWRSEDGGCDEFTAGIDAQNAATCDVSFDVYGCVDEYGQLATREYAPTQVRLGLFSNGLLGETATTGAFSPASAGGPCLSLTAG